MKVYSLDHIPLYAQAPTLCLLSKLYLCQQPPCDASPSRQVRDKVQWRITRETKRSSSLTSLNPRYEMNKLSKHEWWELLSPSSIYMRGEGKSTSQVDLIHSKQPTIHKWVHTCEALLLQVTHVKLQGMHIYKVGVPRWALHKKKVQRSPPKVSNATS